MQLGEGRIQIAAKAARDELREIKTYHAPEEVGSGIVEKAAILDMPTPRFQPGQNGGAARATSQVPAERVEPALRELLGPVHRDLRKTMFECWVGKAVEQLFGVGIEILTRKPRQQSEPLPRPSIVALVRTAPGPQSPRGRRRSPFASRSRQAASARR